MTSYTMFDTFELDWLNLISIKTQGLTAQKYFVIMELVVEAICILNQGEWQLKTLNSVKSPFNA
jgi:hypothetical protein